MHMPFAVAFVYEIPRRIRILDVGSQQLFAVVLQEVIPFGWVDNGLACRHKNRTVPDYLRLRRLAKQTRKA